MRVGAITTALYIAALQGGCASTPPARQASPTTQAEDARRASVRPGINDAYEHPEVEKWVARFEGESREIYAQRGRIVDVVGLRSGMIVADVGAGTGLFTLPFAERVGNGKVVAVDIVPEFLKLIRERARSKGLYNVQTVLCDDDSVRLPPASVDLVFLCDTYHHFEYPQATLSSIRRALRPGGTMIVIDFERIPETSRPWILEHVRAGEETVISEIERAGFVPIPEPIDASFLDENYILRFRRP